MDPSPAKRRKTSPSTAVAANASNTTFRPVSQDGEQTTPSRASFMSPTKASLARFNPSLLPRPKVAAAGAPRLGQTPFEQQPSRIARKGRTGNGSARRSQPTTPTRELGGLEKTEATTTNARAATASPGRTTRSLGGGMFGAPRRRSHTPGRASLVVKAISANPEVNVVASPPEATDTAQDIVDGQLEQELQDGAARRLGRVANAEEAMDNSDKADPEEPELPPTPTELGLEPQPERPKGLLFSSPSRRARKKKGTSVKSSPLKPRDPPPEKPPESVPIAPMKAAPLQQTKMPDVDEELTSKQKERDKLSRQLQSLRADVARLEGEVARTQETAHVDPRSQVEVDELLSILTTTNPSHREIRPKHQQPPLSHRLSLFLPFSKQPLLAPSKAPVSNSPLPSHHPVPLPDPLPHLRLFTPLTITSTNVLLPSTAPNAPLLQRHDITLTSPHDLLIMRLSLTANATTETVENLNVISLSPWAIPELEPWIRKRALDGDISSIGWATARYWDVAQLRAICWEQCEREHEELLAHKGTQARPPTNRKTPALLKRRGRPRNADKTQVVKDHTDDDATDDDMMPEQSISRHDLLTHLGRSSFLFQHDGISLLISWRLDLDWTGEVQSHMAAQAAFPERWARADDRNSLAKVGQVFQQLVRVKGVFGAVAVIVRLLFRE
ncbi:MAG: hypothetical protein LQ347_006884 [Umbilicaria vellea]|nr:MAG: hypothetical protein LQ347_006884 [Umbilicaria vellea]